MTRIVGIYGAGGAGRGVMPLLREQEPSVRAVFIDDGLSGQVINGHDVLSWETFSALEGDKAVSLAIANSHLRARLAGNCASAAIPLIHIQAKNVIIMDDVEIREGAVLSPFVTITSNIRIGCCFHANLYSYVEHDARIGDFVTFAPGAKCNGNVEIHDHAYIGSGAVIRQGKPGAPLVIGKDAVVGMGAVVTKDVPAGVTVVGNPARPMEKR